MPIGPAEAASLIHTVLHVESPPRASRDVLFELINTQGWFSGTSAEDKTDAWLPRFISRLQYIADEGRNAGGYISFTFNSSGTDYIQGYCFCEPADPPHIQNAKKLRAQTINIFEYIKGITDRQFEALSGKILELLKVERSFVSKRSADQGVDFYGRVQLGDILKPKLLDAGAEKNMSVWIVGQSKHYPETRVSTNEIRELVGSIELARAKVYAGSTDPLSELSARLCDPIIYMFFSSGKFTRDSKSLLDASGVLSFNGLQIAQFLADHAVGIASGTFDKPLFDAWLAT